MRRVRRVRSVRRVRMRSGVVSEEGEKGSGG